MRKKLNTLMKTMVDYYEGDPKRIQHFIKVASLAKEIASLEDCDKEVMHLVEATGYVHDIGIRKAEKEVGYSTPKLQEEYGPDLAKEMMEKLHFKADFIDRVCFIVGHHHTIKAVDGLDFQIIIEADFLVNAYEDDMPKSAIINARDHFFKTASGIAIINAMFGLDK